MSWLLDTNVLSEARKAMPNPCVMSWLYEQDESTLFLSVVTVGELERGVQRLPESKKRRTLLD
jgi:predicted nucleic acid-binding protein